MIKDLYKELKQRADQHRYLYHYTNSDSASLILQNKSFKLNRLDKVNDQMENKRINSIWNAQVFAACFTHTKDNEKIMSKMYGNVRLTIKYDKDKDLLIYQDGELNNRMKICEKPARSDLSHHRYDRFDDWCIFDTSVCDIYYTDNLSMHITEDGQESNAGLIKKIEGFDDNNIKRNWAEEAETRIRVTVRPKGFEAYLNKDTNLFEKNNSPFTELYVPVPGEIVGVEVISSV